MSHTSAGRGISGTNLVVCVTSLDTEVSRGAGESYHSYHAAKADIPRKL